MDLSLSHSLSFSFSLSLSLSLSLSVSFSRAGPSNSSYIVMHSLGGQLKVHVDVLMYALGEIFPE